MIIKRDGKASIMFNPITGLKVRVSPDVYEKSTTPELVDIKLTNYCAYGCEFCYQSSTKEGIHGDTDYILTVIDELSKQKTFEVAFGGGEPAEHPDFVRILNYTKKSGVVPNFTTFGTSWLKNQEILQAVKETVGGIGVSVHDSKTVSKYRKIKEALVGSRVKVMVQHVFGTVGYEELIPLAESVDHILYLGYKTVGFGNRFQPTKYTSDEVKNLLSLSNKKISVDTAFVDNYRNILLSMGIKKELITSPEGKFSCYVDAVTKKMGPSSYIEEAKMISLSDISSFKQIYATF